MLKIKYSSLVIIGMLLTACQSGTQTSEKTITPEASTPEISQVDTQPDPQIQPETQTSDFSEFKTTLQGVWERTTYPYGTIEFENNRVKFTQGEGAVEEPQFESFKIADECTIAKKDETSALAYDFLVVDDRYCEAIKLNDGILSIIYSGSNEGIEYKRIGTNNGNSTASANQAIPANFHGKWASTKENCTAINPQQMQISANELSFFENQAELVAITQFEPTRIEGKFNYRVNNKSTPYNYTLDLQNQEKVLIMRENGDNARPGPIRYEKCV